MFSCCSRKNCGSYENNEGGLLWEGRDADQALHPNCPLPVSPRLFLLSEACALIGPG